VKALVRARDLRICRVPGCSRRDIEVAHVRPKGMGGDHGLRTVTSNLICLCVAHHRGPAPSVHSATLRIEGDCDGLVTVSVRAGGTWYALGRC
jgi:hypothetical protein